MVCEAMACVKLGRASRSTILLKNAKGRRIIFKPVPRFVFFYFSKSTLLKVKLVYRAVACCLANYHLVQ